MLRFLKIAYEYFALYPILAPNHPSLIDALLILDLSKSWSLFRRPALPVVYRRLKAR
jgi:hypothetical protein